MKDKSETQKFKKFWSKSGERGVLKVQESVI